MKFKKNIVFGILTAISLVSLITFKDERPRTYKNAEATSSCRYLYLNWDKDTVTALIYNNGGNSSTDVEMTQLSNNFFMLDMVAAMTAENPLSKPDISFNNEGTYIKRIYYSELCKYTIPLITGSGRTRSLAESQPTSTIVLGGSNISLSLDNTADELKYISSPISLNTNDVFSITHSIGSGDKTYGYSHLTPNSNFENDNGSIKTKKTGQYIVTFYPFRGYNQSSGNAIEIKLNSPEPQEYNITYKDQGEDEEYSGSNLDSLPSKHRFGTLTTLIDGIKDGYTFSGWFTTSSCTSDSKITSISASQSSDITLYAKWTLTAEQFAIKFNTDLGKICKVVNYVVLTDMEDLCEKWIELAGDWNTVTDKSTLIDSSEEPHGSCKTKYRYILIKYHNDYEDIYDFMGLYDGQTIPTLSTSLSIFKSKDDQSSLVAIIISTTTLLFTTLGYYLIKKKKED